MVKYRLFLYYFTAKPDVRDYPTEKEASEVGERFLNSHKDSSYKPHYRIQKILSLTDF